MSFRSQRERQLEWAYRKLERAIRMMYRDRRSIVVDAKVRQEKMGEIRDVYRELGRKPHLPRWPL